MDWLTRGAVPSSLSGFPRECAGSPFGDRFLPFLELILKAPALLLGLRYAKRPSGPFGLCVWTVSAATLRHGRAIACAPRLAAVQPHNVSHAQSPTGC